jgi:hypothetical protein
MTKFFRSSLQQLFLFPIVVPVASHNQQMALQHRLSASRPSSFRPIDKESPSSSPQIPLKQQPEEYQHDYDFKAMLPRVEVQLLCIHDVPLDFNVSETFRHFYQEFFSMGLSHQEDKDPLPSSHAKISQTDVGDQVDDDVNRPFDIELFTFVSQSHVYDIKPREEFYDHCDPTSTTVLVTMDVRGYIGIRTNQETHIDEPLDGIETQDNMKWLMDQINPSAIKDFFAEHICSSYPVDDDDDNDDDDDHHHHHNNNNQADMDQHSPSAVVGTDAYAAIAYFKAKVQPWDTRLAPPPPSSSRDYPYPSTKDHRHFDHNLRLLCDGGVDAVYPNYHKQEYQGPDNIPSLVIGLLVGMIMVGMILKEMKQKRQPSRWRQPRQNGESTVQRVVNDSASMTWPTIATESDDISSRNNREYEATSSDEIQSV